jgi:hypothetical protein
MDNKAKILGNPVGIPNPKSDWSQNDATKADYIKNKPDLSAYANALTSNVSGSFISVNDVSPIAHTVECKVSGDGVSPEKVKVQLSEKNLIPYPFTDFRVSNSSITADDLGDGGVLLNGTTTTDTYVYLANIYPNNVYMESTANGFAANKYSDAIWTSCNRGSAYIVVKKGTTCNDVVFYPQIEVGSKHTEFEKGIPYKTFTPKADGTVDGIISTSPYMNIFTNNNSVVLDVTYNKDINKAIGGTADGAIGDIETALDTIIAIQTELIGGDSE